MDHAGAVIGPLLAAAVLALGGSLPTVFLASAIPGVIVMVMLWLALPTLPVPAVLVNAPIHWSALDRRLWGLLGAALLLSFAAVPEAFLMIWAGRHGIAVAELPLLWACTSVAKMLMAAPSGRLSDRFGRLPVLLVAWSGRVAVLASLGIEPEGLDGEFHDRVAPGVYSVDVEYSKAFKGTMLTVEGAIADGSGREMSGVLIHPGNFPRSTEGCYVPGGDYLSNVETVGFDSRGIANSAATVGLIRSYLASSVNSFITYVNPPPGAYVPGNYASFAH